MTQFNRLSLGRKLILVVCIPFLSYIIVSVLNITENWQKAKQAEALLSNTLYVQSASYVVHEIQKERGKSGGFINGGISKDELVQQRLETDKKIPLLQASLKSAQIDTATKDKLTAQIARLSDHRFKVDARTYTAGESAQAYTDIIMAVMASELTASEVTDVGGVSKRLNSIYTLETGKEYAGRLRAALTAILSANSAITQVEITKISRFVSAVELSVGAPTMVITPESRHSLDEFLASSNWLKVKSTFDAVFMDWQQGRYNQDPKEYFKTATASIDHLAKIVSAELTFLAGESTRLQAQAMHELRVNLIAVTLTSLFLVAMLWFTIRSITRPINQVIAELTGSAGSVASSSTRLRDASESIASGATQAAASIQETAASMHQISSLIERNSQSASDVLNSSVSAEQAATQGREVISGMATTIQQIQDSNEQAMSSFMETNAQFIEIANVISEITAKTAVINDIVLQTRLLSFNASVEAARAGEHGKGFAVVAEEVGNLAQMSGNAALEIRKMLAESIQKVQAVAEASRRSMEGLLAETKRRVDSGVRSSQECVAVLDQIVERTTTVGQNVAGISSASQEQAAGAKQVNSAISQLDQVTQGNAVAVQQAASAAASLASQSNMLRGAVAKLEQTVFGLSRPVSPASENRFGNSTVEPNQQNRKAAKAA